MWKCRALVAVLGAALCLGTAGLADAQQNMRGQLLYENHCMNCHESLAAIRKSPKARTYMDIRQQVSRWASELKLNWNPADIDDVTLYLNDSYYQFKHNTSRKDD